MMVNDARPRTRCCMSASNLYPNQAIFCVAAGVFARSVGIKSSRVANGASIGLPSLAIIGIIRGMQHISL